MDCLIRLEAVFSDDKALFLEYSASAYRLFIDLRVRSAVVCNRRRADKAIKVSSQANVRQNQIQTFARILVQQTECPLLDFSQFAQQNTRSFAQLNFGILSSKNTSFVAIKSYFFEQSAPPM